jgi:transposase-like protein
MDIDTIEILGVYLSISRSSFDTPISYLKMMMYYSNKPLVIVDRQRLYPWALKRCGLKWKYETFGERNRAGILKHRTNLEQVFRRAEKCSHGLCYSLRSI